MGGAWGCLQCHCFYIPLCDGKQDAAAQNLVMSLGKSAKEGEANVTTWQKICSFFRLLAFWKAPVMPTGIYAPKKVLVTSPKTAIFMATPFAIWGIIVVIINAMGHAQMAEVNTPIALFNIVAFVQVRAERERLGW